MEWFLLACLLVIAFKPPSHLTGRPTVPPRRPRTANPHKLEMLEALATKPSEWAAKNEECSILRSRARAALENGHCTVAEYAEMLNQISITEVNIARAQFEQRTILQEAKFSSGGPTSC